MRRTLSVRRTLAPLCAALLTATGSSAAPAPTAPSWGFFSYTKDFLSGASNTRWGRATAIVWTAVERPPGSGSYDWTKLDAGVRNGQKMGLNAVLVLKTGNGSSFSDPVCFQRVEAEAAAGGFPNGRELASCPILPGMESAWSRMVTELVERYDADGNRDMPGLTGNVHVDIQVENESANWEFWDFGEANRTLAADRYLRLLQLSHQARTVADPNTQVILTGLVKPYLLARCEGNPACDPDTLQKSVFTKRILGRPDLFDAVDVHFFSYYHFDPTSVDEGAQWVVDQMQQRGYQRPLYSLEWNGSSMLQIADGNNAAFIDYFPYAADFPTVDAFWAMYEALDASENLTYRKWFEAEQAKEFGKVFANVLALGFRRLVHVQYSDYRDGAVWDSALWNWQGVIKYVGGVPVRKPSYYTYNILSDRLVGFTAARKIDQANGVRLYEFTFPAKPPVYVLWTDGAPGVVDLSSVMARPLLRVTYLVTELDGANAPVTQPDGIASSAAVWVGDIPVVLKGIQ